VPASPDQVNTVDSDPGSRGSITLYVVFAVAALGVHLAIATFALPGVLSGGLIETDGYLRLVRVERLWETGAWFDSTLPRVNAPFGDTLHWTRPYDVWMLLGAFPLMGAVPARTAIHWSSVASTPILLVLACLLAVWAVRPLVPSRARQLAMLLLFFQAGVLMVSLPGRGDHHTLIIGVFVLTLGALFRLLRPESTPRFPALAGCAMALGIWISTEFLVVWAAVLFALALAWVAEGREELAERARALLIWTAGATLLALVIERGPGAVLIVEYDKISIAHVGVATLGAAVWSAIVALGRREGAGDRFWGRLAVMGAGGAVAAGTIAVLFPGFFGGPWADIPPEVKRFHIEMIREYQPLLPTPEGIGQFVAFLGPVVLALAYTAWRLWRDRGTDGWSAWLLLACLLLFYLPLSMQNLRFAPPAEVPAAIALVPLLASAFGRFDARYARPLPAVLKASSAIAVLWGFLIVGGLLMPEPAGPQVAGVGQCRLDRLAPVLARPDGLGDRSRIIVAHQDFGPELLYRTRHAVLATSFHRNMDAVREVREILVGSDDARSLEAIERRGADLILICPQARGAYFAADPQQSGGEPLYGRLVRGAAPEWLRPVALAAPGTEGFLLFEVIR
jgi:hypothetical protein